MIYIYLKYLLLGFTWLHSVFQRSRYHFHNRISMALLHMTEVFPLYVVMIRRHLVSVSFHYSLLSVEYDCKQQMVNPIRTYGPGNTCLHCATVYCIANVQCQIDILAHRDICSRLNQNANTLSHFICRVEKTREM